MTGAVSLTIDELVHAVATSAADRHIVLAEVESASNPQKLDDLRTELLGYLAEDGLFLVRLAEAVQRLSAKVAQLEEAQSAEAGPR